MLKGTWIRRTAALLAQGPSRSSSQTDRAAFGASPAHRGGLAPEDLPSFRCVIGHTPFEGCEALAYRNDQRPLGPKSRQ
jgi:hypothetical protein